MKEIHGIIDCSVNAKQLFNNNTELDGLPLQRQGRFKYLIL